MANKAKKLSFNQFRNGGNNTVLSAIRQQDDKIKALYGQVQHLSALLWLALDQNGQMIVDRCDLAPWPANRAIQGQNIFGTEKVAWSAVTQQAATSSAPSVVTPAGESGCSPSQASDPSK